MRLVEEEERDRRPPWYMPPEQFERLQEEIRQQDQELEQRLIELRQTPLAPTHLLRRWCGCV
eukprot:10014936-Heterocapsa_arctica.AAC.1